MTRPDFLRFPTKNQPRSMPLPSDPTQSYGWVEFLKTESSEAAQVAGNKGSCQENPDLMVQQEINADSILRMILAE